MKTLLTVFATLLSTLTAFSQNNNSLLYEISGNNLEQPSYLFGTIHLMCPDDIRISDVLKEKVQNTNQLVLELDMDDSTVMQQMQSGMVLPDGQTLHAIISQEDYTLLDQFFQDSLKMPLSMMEQYDPLMLSAVVSMQMLHCQPGSYEAELVKLAQAQQEETLGLETVEEQLTALRKVPTSQQVEYLVEMVEDYDRMYADFTKMIAAYQAQQADTLYAVMQETMDEVEGMEQYLLIERNQNWIPKMTKMMQTQPTFFGVGAGHLGGEKGVLALLREKGYTVTPVKQ